MSDDELFPDPPPVAEYRDPELARRFASEPVPGHRAGFWSDLEAGLSAPTEPGLEAVPLEPAHVEPTHLDSPLEPVARPAADRRWGPSRLLAAAAAVLVVASVGGMALIAGTRSSSTVESASPVPTTAASTSTTSEATVPRSTTSTAAFPASTTTTASQSPAPPADAEGSVDYFDSSAQVRGIGPGQVVGFSPDGSAVLVLDDAPGPFLGCEGAERLALYTQDLATGERSPTFGDDTTIETGGVELRVSPFGETPADVATRPVYWTEFCDGEAGPVQRGVLSADGRISMVEVLGAGDRHPFATTGPAAIPSPDGTNALVVSGGAVEVVELDDRGRPVADRPAIRPPDSVGPVSVTRAAWAPEGRVVALGSADAVIMWDPWTGEHQRFDNGSTVGLAFDPSGNRLAVVSLDDGLRSSIVSFGDLPAPAAAEARCSGRVDLDPLTAEALAAAGLPDGVATTALAIDRAAATCDWAALANRTDEDFVASFGGDDAVALWETQERQGSSPMWYLRTLLRQPNAVEGALGDPIDPARFVWPTFHLDADCEFGDDERRTLEALAYDADRVAAECGTIGGYLGYRTAIDETGRWRYFVAGD